MVRNLSPLFLLSLALVASPAFAQKKPSVSEVPAISIVATSSFSNMVRFNLKMSGSVPSNCRLISQIKAFKDGLNMNVYSPQLFDNQTRTLTPQLEIDGLENGRFQVYVSSYTICSLHNSERQSKTVSSNVAIVQTLPPTDYNSSAPSISNLRLVSNANGKITLEADIRSSGVHHAITSLDGHKCVGSSSAGDIANCLITDIAVTYGNGGAINNQTDDQLWVAAYAPQADGSRRLRLDVTSIVADPNAPMIYKLEIVDTLGRKASAEISLK